MIRRKCCVFEGAVLYLDEFPLSDVKLLTIGLNRGIFVD